MALSDRDIVAIVDAEFESSMGHAGGEISSERALSWDYYLSKPLGNEVEGRSQVVTSDVSDVVDSVMPSLLRLFTNDENLVNFEPHGVEDTQLARQESDYVNYVFWKRQDDPFILLYNWFFDALVQKNGIIKCWFDESEEVTEESYSGLTEEAFIALLNDEELEVVDRDEKTLTEMTPMGEVSVTLHDVTFKRTTTEGRIRIENVPPEEFRISSDARHVNPSKARMVGHERDITRSDLISMGYDKDLIYSLPSVGMKYGSEEDISRRDKTDEDQDAILKRANELVRVREAFIRIDKQENGKTELRQVIVAGGELLEDNPAERQPFHVLSPQPLPHKFFGRALAEKVMDVQRVNTTLVRQMLDNYYHTNNPGHAVWEQGIGDDTLDDLLTTEIGSIKRFARPPAESYQPITVPFVAGNAFAALEYFDKVKRDRTGIHGDSDGLNPESLKHIQQSVMAESSDLHQMKIETIARIFAETGIKSLFLHIHELILKHFDRSEVIELRGEVVEVDPTEWRNRKNMTVNVGLGIGSRRTKLMQLQAIWEKQVGLAQTGQMGLTVTPDNLFNTASEIVKNAGLKEPRQFFTDPQGQMAPPQPNEALQLQQQQLAVAQRQQQLDAQELQLKQMKMMLDDQAKKLDRAQEDKHHKDEISIKLEQLQNEVAKMQLQYTGE